MSLIDDDASDPLRQIPSSERVEARQLDRRARVRSSMLPPDPSDLLLVDSGGDQLVVRLP
jgi:hypothetical protein